MNYTEDQIDAIKHRSGNLLILACAGSGKTEVVSRRIAELVDEGVPKSEIIAFTFTERAADELKARIRKHLEDLVPNDPALGDMYVGTIHSFCLNLLKEIDPSLRTFEVMDEARQAALIMSNFQYFQESDSGIGLDQLRQKTRTGGYWETVDKFVTTLSIIHQQNIQEDDFIDADLRRAVRRYRQIAYGFPNYFFDFDQIVSALIEKLINSPEELERLRARFKYLIVDEYQDVDDRQEMLIRLLSDSGTRIHVTAVGDDDQAIYGWRGASIENILTFTQHYPSVTKVTLDKNFRSTHAIVDIANAAIRKIGRREPKNMTAIRWNPNTLGHEEALTEAGDIQLRTFDSDRAEAEWVATRIKQLQGVVVEEKDGHRAIDFADMAILLRSVRTFGQVFHDVLRENGIPVIVKGTGGLFNHDEALLIHAAFSLLARADFSYGEGEEYHRLAERETREFIRSAIERLRENSMMPSANASIFLEWISAERENLDRRNLEKSARGGRLARRIYPQDIFQEMLKVLGSSTPPDPWPQPVMFNLGRLSALIAQFETVHQWITPKDLFKLCMFLGGWAASRVDEGGVEENGSANAVQILTVHAAKGLEWPVVFVPKVSSANFPSNKRNQGPETFLNKKIFDPKSYASGIDGERRLWYVALTRGMKFLNISSQDRYRKKPTDFYKEIKHERVQRDDPIQERKKGKPQPPANIELLPTTFTELSYFDRCPFEYQLRALMNFGPGVKESYGYGQQIHNVLAEVHKKALDGEELSTQEAVDLMEKRFHLRYTRDGNNFKPFSALKEAAKLTLRRYFDRFPDTTKYVLEAEKPFEFIDKESGALISGSIDLLQRVESTSTGRQRVPVAVIDFKTHRWKDISSFVESKNSVEMQLRLYSLAVREALNLDAVFAQAHFLSPKGPEKILTQQGVTETIDVDISSPRQEEAKAWVRGTVEGIVNSVASGHFELKGCKNGYCKKCDFRKFCPGYSVWDERDRTTPRPLSLEEERAMEALSVKEDVEDAWTAFK